ncbi:hypothetical protein M011DRAFT_225716, partial [Sporormia fimetaria CBS 119925]
SSQSFQHPTDSRFQLNQQLSPIQSGKASTIFLSIMSHQGPTGTWNLIYSIIRACQNHEGQAASVSARLKLTYDEVKSGTHTRAEWEEKWKIANRLSTEVENRHQQLRHAINTKLTRDRVAIAHLERGSTRATMYVEADAIISTAEMQMTWARGYIHKIWESRQGIWDHQPRSQGC